MLRASDHPQDHGSEISLVLKAAAAGHCSKARSRCSFRDSIETKENSAVKFPALSKLIVSPLVPRKLDFNSCAEDPVFSPIRPIRRGRTSIQAHQEKRFKGTQQVVPKVMVEFFDAKGTGQFFRCYRDEILGADRGTDLPQGQDDDCDTDEETAETMQRSLAAVLEEALLNSR